MADTLELGGTMFLKTPLQMGMVLAFKSEHLDITPSNLGPTKLQLWNEDNDIALQILIQRRPNRVIFMTNACRQLSLLDGWGKAEEIRNVASSSSPTSNFTISVHDCGYQYQVLFNLTTVHYFHKRFSITSTATKVTYLQESGAGTLSQSLKVSVYKVTTLPYKEKLAIQTGSPPNTHVYVDSGKASVPQAQLTASPMYSFTGLSWEGGDQGTELRIYHLGPGNVLQDYAYSVGSGKGGWSQGKLHKLGIVLNPGSALSAIRMDRYFLRIYYQIPESGFIQALLLNPENDSWIKGRIIARAVKGSSIASVVCSYPNGDAVYVYYQDLDLHVREKIWSPDEQAWVTSGFDTGAQPCGTQIFATSSGLDVQVSWKDAKGGIMSANRPKSLGCSSSALDDESKNLDGRD